VSLFIQGFEIEDAESEEGSGIYTPPPFRNSGMHVGGLKPAQDVLVRLRRRQGLEDVEWQFEM
jgi:valyl-tRNA synthetase